MIERIYEDRKEVLHAILKFSDYARKKKKFVY